MNDPNRNNPPIRRYRRQKGYDSYRNAAIVLMVGIIAVGLIVFIMSLTGTGLFADPSVPDDPDLTEGTGDEDTDEGTDDSGEKETRPVVTKPLEELAFKVVGMTPTDIGIGELVLIDATHPYGFPEEQMSRIYDFRTGSYGPADNTVLLKLSVIERLNALMDAFAADTGFTQTRVNVGFRSLAKQQELYERYPNSAALPGCSDYHTGASVTLDRYDRESGLVYPLSNTSESLWLRENAHKYGFTFRYPTEKSILTGYDYPWWIRYVGIPHATYMYERFFCLEEYLAYVAENHRYGGNHLRVSCADGCVYEIYYVEGASEGLIQVPVPSNREYTVSGDNKKGFIVTFLADVSI